MRRRRIAAVAILTTLTAASLAQSQAEKDKAKGKERLIGTWENISPGFPQNTRQVKIINENYEMWASYDRVSGAVGAVAGGPYTFDGDTYKEKVEFGHFGSPQLQTMVGKEQTFTLKFD